MPNIDKEIQLLLAKHKTCDESCPELWLVKQLKKHREALKIYSNIVPFNPVLNKLVEELDLD